MTRFSALSLTTAATFALFTFAAESSEPAHAVLDVVSSRVSSVNLAAMASAGTGVIGERVLARAARLDDATMCYLTLRFEELARQAREPQTVDGLVMPASLTPNAMPSSEKAGTASEVMDTLRFERVEREARKLEWQVRDAVETLKAQLRDGTVRPASAKRAIIRRMHALNAVRRANGEMFRVVKVVRRDRQQRAEAMTQDRDPSREGMLTDQIASVD